jgi:dihydrofolate reductase
MRKLIAHLFISLDGVVEAPDAFVRPELYEDFDELMEDFVSGQDAVLLGANMYQEWSQFWPGSDIEPFASFINNNQKFVVSSSLKDLAWPHSTLVSGNLATAIAELKAQPGKSIGVHGSIALVQSLLLLGLIDELKLIQVPAVAGHGRRLLDHQGAAIQLNLKSTRATPGGLQYFVYAVEGQA